MLTALMLFAMRWNQGPSAAKTQSVIMSAPRNTVLTLSAPQPLTASTLNPVACDQEANFDGVQAFSVNFYIYEDQIND